MIITGHHLEGAYAMTFLSRSEPLLPQLRRTLEFFLPILGKSAKWVCSRQTCAGDAGRSPRGTHTGALGRFWFCLLPGGLREVRVYVRQLSNFLVFSTTDRQKIRFSKQLCCKKRFMARGVSYPEAPHSAILKPAVERGGRPCRHAANERSAMEWSESSEAS